MITVAVNSITSFASGFVIFMFLVRLRVSLITCVMIRSFFFPVGIHEWSLRSRNSRCGWTRFDSCLHRLSGSDCHDAMGTCVGNILLPHAADTGSRFLGNALSNANHTSSALLSVDLVRWKWSDYHGLERRISHFTSSSRSIRRCSLFLLLHHRHPELYGCWSVFRWITPELCW